MKTCPHCNGQIGDTASFCIHCMTSLEPKTAMSAIKSKKGWRVLVAVLLVLVLLFSISVIAIFSLVCKLNKKETGAPSKMAHKESSAIVYTEISSGISAIESDITSSDLAVSDAISDPETQVPESQDDVIESGISSVPSHSSQKPTNSTSSKKEEDGSSSNKGFISNLESTFSNSPSSDFTSSKSSSKHSSTSTSSKPSSTSTSSKSFSNSTSSVSTSTSSKSPTVSVSSEGSSSDISSTNVTSYSQNGDEYAVWIDSFSALSDLDPTFTFNVENGSAIITDVSRDLYGDVTIPSEILGYPVVGISSGAFTNGYITSVVIPKSVTFIDQGAFKYCSSLQTAKIKAPVSSIEASCFIGCESLKTVYITDSVKTVDRYAFDFCDNLTDVYYAGSEKQRGKIEISEQKSILPESVGNKALTDATWHYNCKF